MEGFLSCTSHTPAKNWAGVLVGLREIFSCKFNYNLPECDYFEMIWADTPRQGGASPSHSDETFSWWKNPVCAN